MGVVDNIVARRRVVDICRRMLGLEMSPLERAALHRRLGALLMDLSAREERPLETAALAIESYKKALLLIDRSLHPDQYAELQRNVGEAYLSLADITDDRRDALLQSAQAFEESLRITGSSADMLASCHERLAECFSSLADIEDRAGNCRMAIREYREALQAFDPESIQSATVHSNLSSVFRRLAEVTETEKNCLLAADACRDALLVYTIKRPDEHALMQKRLGDSLMAAADYSDLAEKKAGLLDEAVLAYSSALKIYSPEISPFEYAGTLKHAIKAYKKALRVYSREGSTDLSRKPVEARDISPEDIRMLADECLSAIRRCRIALKATNRGE